MIVVRLMGGLGNQMFQYAAGRSLAIRHRAELKLDLSFLSKAQDLCTSRTFELQHLNVSAALASPLEVALLTGRGRNRLETCCSRLLQAAGMTRLRPNIYREGKYHYEAAFETVPDQVYMDGYWQSERYFREVEDVIRREFEVTAPLDDRNRELARRIQETEAVSVHVRRGDYVTDAKTAGFHGTCGLEYYRHALEVMSARVGKPAFFVFSDDPQWCREHLDFLGAADFVDINADSPPCYDLRLMSLCTHHVIANSSFSWWGAWLGRAPGKVVIAPARWYREGSIDTDLLCPADWLRI